MTSPTLREGEIAREILRLEAEKEGRIKEDGGADTSGYAVYCYQKAPDLARAYLDALEENERMKAELDRVYGRHRGEVG